MAQIPKYDLPKRSQNELFTNSVTSRASFKDFSVGGGGGGNYEKGLQGKKGKVEKCTV